MAFTFSETVSQESVLGRLLALLDREADLAVLVDSGLTYAEIATLLEVAENRGLLVRSAERGWAVTERGRTFIGQGPGVSGVLIKPPASLSAPTLAPLDIYLPPVAFSYFEEA